MVVLNEFTLENKTFTLEKSEFKAVYWSKTCISVVSRRKSSQNFRFCSKSRSEPTWSF